MVLKVRFHKIVPVVCVKLALLYQSHCFTPVVNPAPNLQKRARPFFLIVTQSSAKSNLFKLHGVF